MLFFQSRTNNPGINLATEEYLFHEIKDDVFMLWQNDRSIILGQYQNAYEEINMERAAEKHIRIVRRMTGGGAVYHDLGNVNFSFITYADDDRRFDFKVFMERIAAALNFLGAGTKIKGRNDLMIDGKKVSGNAQYVSGNRILHHGTLLFDADLSMLRSVLKEEDGGIWSKAGKSDRQKVVNLKGYLNRKMSVEQFQSALRTYILKGDDVKVLMIDAGTREYIQQLAAAKYDRWEWNVGRSPQCNILRSGQWEYGRMKIHMNVDCGLISEFNITGDFFADAHFHQSLQMFIGCRLEKDALKLPVKNCAAGIYGLAEDALLGWILNGREVFEPDPLA